MTTTSKFVFATLALAVTLAGFAGSNPASALPKGIKPLPIKCYLCTPKPVSNPNPAPTKPPHHPDPWHSGWGFYRGPGYYAGVPVVASTAVVASNPVAVAQPVSQTEQASCLSKQYLPDGRALFRDACTNEEAVSEPASAPVPSK